MKILYNFWRKYYIWRTFSKVNTDLKNIVVGPDVCRNFTLANPSKLSIGSGTVINGDCYINALGGVTIGRYCHIAKGLTILSSNHNHRSKKTIPYDEIEILRSVNIGNAVWVGANVSILPGSHIEDGAIISLGAVVRGKVPSCAIVAGNPAVIVGWRDQEIFQRLQKSNAYF